MVKRMYFSLYLYSPYIHPIFSLSEIITHYFSTLLGHWAKAFLKFGTKERLKTLPASQLRIKFKFVYLGPGGNYEDNR